MNTVEAYEAIRRAYFIEGKSIRTIGRELRHGRTLVRKAIAHAEPPGYQLSKSREAPVLGSYKQRLGVLLDESEEMPRKQRYTANTTSSLSATGRSTNSSKLRAIKGVLGASTTT